MKTFSYEVIVAAVRGAESALSDSHEADDPSHDIQRAGICAQLAHTMTKFNGIAYMHDANAKAAQRKHAKTRRKKKRTPREDTGESGG